MSPEDAEEYTGGLGQIVAGSWRQIALGERLGVPQALGLTTREWVEERVGGYVRLSIPERREAVAELAGEDMPNTKIADVLGVDERTVRRDSASAGQDDQEQAATTSQESASAEPGPVMRPDGLVLPEDPMYLEDEDRWETPEEVEADMARRIREAENFVPDDLEEQPDIQAVTFARHLFKALSPVEDIPMRFRPERVADVAQANPDVAARIETARRELENWFADTAKAMATTPQIRRIK